MMKLRTRSGLNPDVRNLQLHYAVARGDQETVNKILLQGPDLNLFHGGVASLHAAIQKGDPVMIKSLIDNGADINLADRYGRTPIHVAALEGNSRVVRLMLDYGADIERADNRGMRALHIAAKRRHSRIIKILLDHSADPKQATNQGWRPIHFAAFYCNPSMLRILLDYGADAEVRDKKGRRPLHLAIHCVKSVKYLLEHGVDINAQDNDGYTALHHACTLAVEDVIVLLLEGGTDITLTNSYGSTPFRLARGDYDLSDDDWPETYRAWHIGLQMIKNYVAGFPVDQQDLQKFRNDTVIFEDEYYRLWSERVSIFSSDEEELLNEITKLKNYRPSGTVSLYHIFSAKDPMYRSDEILAEALKSIDFKEYRLYGEMIRRKIKADEEKFNLIVLSKDSFDLFIKLSNSSLPSLPGELIQKILTYLKSNSDLQTLICCGRSLGKQMKQRS